MRLPKLALTKRLSVRLGALGTVLASGGIAGVQVLWPSGDEAKSLEAPPAAVATTGTEEDLKPIPDPAATESRDEFRRVPSETGLPEMPRGYGLPPDQTVEPAVALSVPSPHDTVVRGNDDHDIMPTSGETPLVPPEPRASGGSIYGAGGDAALPTFEPPRYGASEAPSERASAPPASPPPASTFSMPSGDASDPSDPNPDGARYALSDAPSHAVSDVGDDAVGVQARELSPDEPDPPALRPQVDATASVESPESAIPSFTPPADATEWGTPSTAEPGPVAPVPSPALAIPAATAMTDSPTPEPRAFQAPADATSASPQTDIVRAELPGSILPTSRTAEGTVQGQGVPGSEQMEGIQTPSLSVEKIAPDEIQVGKEATFRTRIRNVGNVTAHDVVVIDQIPRGTQLVTAVPDFVRSPEGQLMWQLDMLKPGDEIEIAVRLSPTTEGEIGSVAQVLFATPASVRTVCTRPQLAVNHTGPSKVLIGEAVTFDIVVSNPGTGTTTGIVLEENVPEGLNHPVARELQRDVGDLRPGDSTRLQLSLTAAKAGVIEHELIVRGDGGLLVRDKVQMEVIAPRLQVTLNGPKLRYLERPATYEVTIANPGTATAREVELVTYLPKGMKFVDADHKGQYEPQNHAVYWSVAELPPDQTGIAKLTVLPTETGPQPINVEARAELGLQHSHEKVVSVESLAELQFTVADTADPIEVGSDTIYEITLTNSGSSAATEIQLAIGLQSGMKPLGGEGPTRVTVQGDQLSIDSLARLGSGETATYRIKLQGVQAGPQRIQVQLVTAETPVPVAKEEITRVYADR